MSMGQEDLKIAGGTQVMVPSNFRRALVLSSTRKSPTALCMTCVCVCLYNRAQVFPWQGGMRRYDTSICGFCKGHKG